MHANKGFILSCAVACVAAAIVAPTAVAYTNVTKSFQAGVNGTTESDIQFTSSYDNSANAGNVAGATGTQLFVDGYNGTDSPDQQVFLKYTNLFGTGANQIPLGAFIISADLTLTTGTGGNSQSGGPFGVGGVLFSWTGTDTYNTFKAKTAAGAGPENGLNAVNGLVTRAVGFYDDPTVLYNGTNALESAATAATKGTTKIKYTANVAPIVQAWSSGTYANNGFNIHAGVPSATTDGWQIKTGTHGTVADRPLLNITYTTHAVTTAKFQQGVNGYNGTAMSWVRLETDSGADGAGINNAFLDGWQFAPDMDDISSDDHALIKFNNLFQGAGGNIPKTAKILKATLVLTTSNVGNAQTGQPYQAHQMLRDWSTSTSWTDFDSNYGIRTGVDESAMLSAQYGMVPDSQAQFDITQAVANWAIGQANYGIDIRATPPDPQWSGTNGTADGWSIYFTGATDPTLRPQLVISYIPRLPGDANENDKIDFDDFALIDRGFNKHLTGWSNGDFNVDGVINSADYLLLDTAWAAQGGHPLDPSYLAAREAQFGADYAAALVAAVPEPTSLGLLAAALPLAARRRTRRA